MPNIMKSRQCFPTMLSRIMAKNVGDVFLRHSVILDGITNTKNTKKPHEFAGLTTFRDRVRFV